jgi:hypothetical protein
MTSLGFPLIHNLSIQRQGVCELLGLIQPEDLRLENGLNLLVSLQVRVLFHLRVEDDLLVAILDAEARHKPEIAVIMNQWIYPLRSCAELAEAFFQHWLGLEGPIGDLQGDWESLKSLLLLRMDRSEKLLYPAYKALHNERRRKSRPAAIR